jgi:septal ring factor EnvC (AmiA/AmiB activator)
MFRNLLRTYIFIIPYLVFSVILCASAMDEAARKAQQLQELKQSRDRAKREKSAILAKEEGVLAELRDIEKQLTARQRELRIYELNLARCEREIKQLEEALVEAELRSKQTRTLMIRRLRAMYKFGYEGGQLSYLKLLLEADNISGLVNRYKYMSALANGDRKLLEKAVAEKAEIDLRKKQVEARRKRILDYKGGAERIRREILSKKTMRQDILAELQRSKEHLTRTLNELGKSVEELEDLMVQLRTKSEESSQAGMPVPLEITDLGEQRGRLSWPVSGKIVKNSAPSMKGITIQARYGADIQCVAGGIVEYARWFDGVGFGQMVIVDHGNGYRTLYAHASELLVEEGQKVKTGQTIAKVGDTGSLMGPILYFEIWKGTKAMRTRQWLR